MIVFHIAVAVASIIFTTVAYFATSRLALRGAYIGAAMTLLSGIYLVVAQPATLLHVCLAGVVYLAIISVGIVLARSRVVRVQKVISHK